MSTEFCTHCKQSHPGRVCDYDDQGECAETVPQPETPPLRTAELPTDCAQPDPPAPRR